MPVFLFLRSGVVTLFGLNVGDTAIVSTPSGVDWAFPLHQPHFLPPRFASPRGVSKRRLGSWNECQEDEVNYADSLLLSVVVLSSVVHSYRCTLPPHAHMQALVPKQIARLDAKGLEAEIGYLLNRALCSMMTPPFPSHSKPRAMIMDCSAAALPLSLPKGSLEPHDRPVFDGVSQARPSAQHVRSNRT